MSTQQAVMSAQQAQPQGAEEQCHTAAEGKMRLLRTATLSSASNCRARPAAPSSLPGCTLYFEPPPPMPQLI